MRTLVFLLAAYGISHALTALTIGTPFRRLMTRLGKIPGHFSHCIACTGFWVGLALSFLWSPMGADDVHGMSRLGLHVVDSAAASGVNWLLYIVMVRLGQPESGNDEPS